MVGRRSPRGDREGKPRLVVEPPPKGLPPELAQATWDEAKKHTRRSIWWANLGILWNTFWMLIDLALAYWQTEYGWRLLFIFFMVMMGLNLRLNFQSHKKNTVVLDLMLEKEKEWREVGNRPW